jgi:class 3 adenylate cyclase
MLACPTCGKLSEEDARFCAACGTPLETQAKAEERKTVTILFCDLVGSTSMGERLDSEASSRVMGRYYTALRRAIARHGGSVEKFIGDAVMAVFGIPTVHEDDAVRAVRAVADIQAELAEMNRELHERWGAQLRTRIGVNTGEVVTGDPMRGEPPVVGDAVNVAARVERATRELGDRVLITEATRCLLTRDEIPLEERGTVPLKGKSEPVPIWAPDLEAVGAELRRRAALADAPSSDGEPLPSAVRGAFGRPFPATARDPLAR